jgi:flagellin
MGRINTNVQSMIAQRVLSQNNLALGGSLERLSTGFRINRGKDDPAGLIASENLRSEEKSLNQAVTNAERADQVVNIAEGGLQEVSGLLTELQGLLTATASRAGLSLEEKTANQLQIDSILQTIDRVASATNFQGTKLLNGNLDFRTSSIATGVSDFKVNSAKFSGDSLGVSVLVTESAQQGALFLSMGGTTLDLGTNSTFVIEIGGSQGNRELSFADGTSLASIVDAINSYVDVTGVRASLATASSTMINLTSDAFGSSEYVSVKIADDGGLNGNVGQAGIYRADTTDQNTVLTTGQTLFTGAINGVRDDGQNVGATVNGVRAISTGKVARVSTDFLNVELTLDTSTSQTIGNVGSGGNPAFYITGGGADFQLSSKADISGKVALGIQDVAARRLGNTDVGFLSSLSSGKSNNVVSGDILQGQKVVAEAIKQLSSLRGRLGAFQKNTVGATIRSLGIAIENTAAAQSIIRDANFAEETAGLTRAQILVSSSTNVLGLANQQPQAALQLLG